MSQMETPRPSAFVEPSTWYAEVAAPQRNPAGNRMGLLGGVQPLAVGVGFGTAESGAHAASAVIIAAPSAPDWISCRRDSWPVPETSRVRSNSAASLDLGVVIPCLPSSLSR